MKLNQTIDCSRCPHASANPTTAPTRSAFLACRRRSAPPELPENDEIQPDIPVFGSVCESGSAQCTPYTFRCRPLLRFWRPLDQAVSSLTSLLRRDNQPTSPGGTTERANVRKVTAGN